MNKIQRWYQISSKEFGRASGLKESEPGRRASWHGLTQPQQQGQVQQRHNSLREWPIRGTAVVQQLTCLRALGVRAKQAVEGRKLGKRFLSVGALRHHGSHPMPGMHHMVHEG